MGVAAVSRDRVEERLASLEEAYSGFPIDQTTIAVPREAYERASERSERGIVDAYVQLYNERGDALLVERDEGWTVPHGEPGIGERVVPGTERAVRERTGVDCEITDLGRVTILGVRDEEAPDRGPVYRLIAVFTAETTADAEAGGADGVATDGTTADGVRWHSTVPDSAVPSH
ncbi:MAG: NUDIX domain-containing protein [Halosimplex sp.]